MFGSIRFDLRYSPLEFDETRVRWNLTRSQSVGIRREVSSLEFDEKSVRWNEMELDETIATQSGSG